MRIVILGAPGSGKGTQARLLVTKYKVPQISTGDLLRASVEANTALGKQAKPFMDAGQLVPDEIVLGLIKERLKEADAKKGFILDGFPRNIPQAEALDVVLKGLKQSLQGVIHIEVDYDTLIQRLTGRRTCVSCGQLYNVYTTPPRMDDRCDKCGGKLRHRADDNEETIGNRLRVYEVQTEPLIEYYRNQGKLRVVHGVGDVTHVFRSMSKVTEQMLKDYENARARAAAEAQKNMATMADLEKKVMEKVRQAVAKAKGKGAATQKAKAKTTDKKKSTSKKATASKKKVTSRKSVKKMAKKTAKKKSASKKAANKKNVARKVAKKNAVTGKKAAKKKSAIKKKTSAHKSSKKKTGKKAARKKTTKRR